MQQGFVRERGVVGVSSSKSPSSCRAEEVFAWFSQLFLLAQFLHGISSLLHLHLEVLQVEYLVQLQHLSSLLVDGERVLAGDFSWLFFDVCVILLRFLNVVVTLGSSDRPLSCVKLM